MALRLLSHHPQLITNPLGTEPQLNLFIGQNRSGVS